MKLIKLLLLIMSGLVIMFSCSQDIITFSEKKPYAVEVKKVRSYYDAQSITDRLKSMGLDPYFVLIQDEGNSNSKWFSIMMGAESELKEIAILQGAVEDVTKMKNTVVVNYNEIAKRIEKIDDSYDEDERINAYDPDVPYDITELINKFPSENIFNVRYLSMHNFPANNDSRSIRKGFYDAKLDLPRGISKRLIADNVRSFAEVIFEDNLYGDQVTIEIMRLRKDGNLHGEIDQNLTDSEKVDVIAKNLSNRVLNTGRYRREELEKINIQSFVDLKGYKVLIEPRKDYLRTYMILLDEKGEFAIFSQSTQKTDDEILSYLKNFGKSEGMLAYNEFYNTFYTIPKCLQNGDVFIGYSSSILDQSYARSRGYANWAKAMVGHSQSTANFYNCILDKSWSASAFDLLTQGKKDYIYGDMYANSDYTGKSPLKVNKRNGYFVKAGYLNYNEVNFSSAGRHVMAIGGSGLDKKELLVRAASFQDGNELKEDVCDEKFFITFWASEEFTSNSLTSPGHAFISFAREDKKKKMTVYDGAWGFHPKERSLRVVAGIYSDYGEVPGEIKDDIKSAKDLGYTILVSKEEYERVMNIKNEWSSKNYQLTVNDCISFVESVASSIKGLKVPKRSKIFNELQLQSIDLGLVKLPIPSPDYEKLIYFPRVFLSELIDVNKGSGRGLCSQ